MSCYMPDKTERSSGLCFFFFYLLSLFLLSFLFYFFFYLFNCIVRLPFFFFFFFFSFFFFFLSPSPPPPPPPSQKQLTCSFSPPFLLYFLSIYYIYLSSTHLIVLGENRRFFKVLIGHQIFYENPYKNSIREDPGSIYNFMASHSWCLTPGF